jgi:hypothetical protein
MVAAILSAWDPLSIKKIYKILFISFHVDKYLNNLGSFLGKMVQSFQARVEQHCKLKKIFQFVTVSRFD